LRWEISHLDLIVGYEYRIKNYKHTTSIAITYPYDAQITQNLDKQHKHFDWAVGKSVRHRKKSVISSNEQNQFELESKKTH